MADNHNIGTLSQNSVLLKTVFSRRNIRTKDMINKQLIEMILGHETKILIEGHYTD